MTKADKKELERSRCEAQFFSKTNHLKQQVGEFYLVDSPNKCKCRICGTQNSYIPKYVCHISTRVGFARTYICYTHLKEEECYSRDMLASMKIQKAMENAI